MKYKLLNAGRDCSRALLSCLVLIYYTLAVAVSLYWGCIVSILESSISADFILTFPALLVKYAY